MLGQYASSGGASNRACFPQMPVVIGATTLGNSVDKLTVYGDSTGKVGATITNANAAAGPAYIAFKGYDWTQAAIWHDRMGAGALQIAINPNTTDLTINGCTPAATFLNSGEFLIGATTQGRETNFAVVGSYQDPVGAWAQVGPRTGRHAEARKPCGYFWLKP